MAFSVKNWTNRMTTRLNAAAMEDLEERLSDYTDSIGAGGVELGHSEITADATKSSTTLADVAGLSTTVTVGSRPIEVTFSCASVSNNAGSGGAKVAIVEDSTVIGGCSQFLGTASNGGALFRRIRSNPSAGSHTYKIQLATIFGGTATISASTGSDGVGPAAISVVEI